MNAHPQIGLLLAGPLAPIDLPPVLGVETKLLAHAPSRVDPDTTAAPEHGSAPIGRADAPLRPGWRRWALVISIVAHAAAAYAIGDRLARGPLDADDPDAVTVELVMETPAPAMPAAAAAPGATDAVAGIEANAEMSADIPPSPEPVSVPEFDPILAFSPPPVATPSSQEANPRTDALLATPKRAERRTNDPPPAAREKPKPAAREKAAKRQKPDEHHAAAPAGRAPVRKQAAPEKPAGRSPKAEKAGAGGKSAGQAAGPSGASAAAKAAYGARLLAHVQRFKRYPAAAKGATGVARLSVTIGRDGGLRGVRLIGASGIGALDEEARATARRAGPFPRPPDGVGGTTITFSVALRFSR